MTNIYLELLKWLICQLKVTICRPRFKLLICQLKITL